MQAKERRRLWVLVALLVVLAAVVWYQLGNAIPAGSTAAAPTAGSRPPGPRVPGQAGSASEAGPVVVDLAWLDRPRPEPITGKRDPFAFGGGPEVREPPAGGVGPAVEVEPALAEGPPEPPPPPPIPYRFIGVLDAPGAGRVAVLSDGRFVYHGREGDIIDGRYRLVSVTSSSVQVEYLDGRGRQTLRLSGS